MSDGAGLVDDAASADDDQDARRLGGEAVAALYRLLKLGQMHALDNQAVVRQLEVTRAAIATCARAERGPVTMLFGRATVIVGGAPLRASRGTYDAAMELGATFQRCGGAELTIAGDIPTEDLRSFVAAVVAVARDPTTRFAPNARRIQLRPAREDALVRDFEISELDDVERVVRTYASAVVLLRASLESLATERPRLPRRLKRIAQSIVDLSAGSTPALLGVTGARNANHDEAGRAVNSAILAVAMGRQVTADRLSLSRLAMAALMFDVGRARLRFRQRSEVDAGWDASESGGARVERSLTDGEQRALPASTVGVLTALGRVHEAAVEQSVIAYEALWLAQREIGLVYRGARAVTMHARIVAMARSYCEQLAVDPGAIVPSPADVVARIDAAISARAPLSRKTSGITAGDSVDRTVLRLLMAAVGVVGVGSLFELASGEVAVVEGASEAGAPLFIRIVLDETGGVVGDGAPIAVDPTGPRRLARMIGTDPSYARRPARTSEAPRASARADTPLPSAVRAIASQTQSSENAIAPAEIRYTDAIAPSSRKHAPDAATQSVHAVVAPPEPKRGPVAEPVREAEIETVTSAINLASALSSGDDTIHTIQSEAPPHDPTIPPPELAPPQLAPALAPMLSELPAPVATGDLDRTPLAHVLVHLLSRSLSGSLALRTPLGSELVFVFEEGCPVASWTSLGLHRLGEVFVQLGALDRARLEVALKDDARDARRLGARLVERNVVTIRTLDQAIGRQIMLRAGLATQTPATTEFQFHEGIDLVARLLPRTGVVSGATPCDPLAAIATIVRGWNAAERMDLTLAKLGQRPVVLHPLADLLRFGFTDAERVALSAIAQARIGYVEQQRRGNVDGSALRSVMYTLAITRHIDIGVADAWPVGVAHVDDETMRAIANEDGGRLTWMPGDAPRGAAPRVDVATSDEAPSSRRSGAPTSARRPSLTGRRSIPAPVNPLLVARRKAITERVEPCDSADHYVALGVSAYATFDEINAAFRRAFALTDPTTLPRELADLEPLATKLVGRLSEAHRVLSNPDLRYAHDELLASEDAPEFAAPVAEEHGVVPGSLGKMASVAESAIDVETHELAVAIDDLDEESMRDAMPPPEPRTVTDARRPADHDGPESRRRR